MPEYDYRCKKCKTEFTIVKGMLEIITVNCPNCKSTDLERIFSKTAVVYKGDGFYTTDGRKPLTNED